MLGPPQVHPRSVRGRRKLAQHRPAGSWLSVAGRRVLPPCAEQQSRAPARYGQSGAVPPISAGLSRLPVDSAGRTLDRPVIAREPGGLFAEGSAPSKPGASGSVNRLLRPESVRHMSVTTATQRLTAARHETRRHNNKKARETGKTQLTGCFRRWWQVLGSNQRRLSRRFYRPLDPTGHMPLTCAFHPETGFAPGPVRHMSVRSPGGAAKPRTGTDGVRPSPATSTFT